MGIFDQIAELRELAVLVISAAAAAEKIYTKPELREKLKNQIMAGGKGGAPGQWSARKAQMLAVAYKAAGGGYNGGKQKSQKSLKTWGKQDWKTRDGKPAIRKDKNGNPITARYLPAAKWDSLSDKEAAASDRKKREGSKKGQFVANTKKAAMKSQ